MKRLRASIITATLLAGWITCSVVAQQSNESRRVSRAYTQDSSKNSAHEVYGKIVSVEGSRITIETRTRQVLKVDAADALRTHMSVPLVVGHAIGVKGMSDAKSVLHAQLILRAKDSLDMWPADQ